MDVAARLGAFFFERLSPFEKNQLLKNQQLIDETPTALNSAIQDTLHFISYAAHKGIPLKDEDIGHVIAANRAGEALTPAQEQNFWISATSISKAVAPVTIESLRASQRIDHRLESAAWAAGRYRARTAVTLAVLLLFQIYWLIGATVVSDLAEIRKRLVNLSVEQIRAMGMPGLDEKDPNYLTLKAKREADDLAFQNLLWPERISAATNFEVLKNWNFAKNWLLWGRNPGRKPVTTSTINASASSDAGSVGATQDEDRVRSTDRYLWEFYSENVVELQTAQIILTAILKYILPILYGALGASAYIVRNLATEIRDHRYTGASNIGYQLRFYLGAVAGLSIAWFTSDPKSSETAGILQSLSPLALAFLSGYSVELLFSFLDRIVLAFSSPQPVKPTTT